MTDGDAVYDRCCLRRRSDDDHDDAGPCGGAIDEARNASYGNDANDGNAVKCGDFDADFDGNDYGYDYDCECDYVHNYACVGNEFSNLL